MLEFSLASEMLHLRHFYYFQFFTYLKPSGKFMTLVIILRHPSLSVLYQYFSKRGTCQFQDGKNRGEFREV